jgi:hypothetical protein
MPRNTVHPADTAPLPRDLLARVSAARERAEAAEREILGLAVEWAVAHPAQPGQEAWRPTPANLHPGDLFAPDPSHISAMTDDDVTWVGLPEVAWDAPAAFAAANAMSTTAGKAVIRDALVLAFRAPQTWARLGTGALTARQARRVAETLFAEPDDVCAHIDSAVAERVDRGRSVGTVILTRLLDEAMLRLHAEERELEQLDALDRRHVTIDSASLNHHGIADLEARADWADLAAFDETLAAVAEILVHLEEHRHESLDVRRSIALGILADPARAHALLDGDLDAAPTRRRELTATVELTEGNLFGLDPVATDAQARAHLDSVLRCWAGRPDINLTVHVLRMPKTAGGADSRATYAPSAAQRVAVERRDRTCVHPHCSLPARACDLDHITPYDPEHPERGPTSVDNLAALCRHHHRLKTHAGWRYTRLGDGTYRWTDPHGRDYLRSA